MKEKFEIHFPSENEIQSEVNQIVSKAMRHRQSFPLALLHLYQQIGLRNLLLHQCHTMGIIASALLTLIALLLLAGRSIHLTEQLYPYIFLISPILYIALSIHDYWYKRSDGTFELEMSAKYNLYQLTALRMLLFSVFSILGNTFVLTLMSFRFEELHILRAICISTTALFIFAIAFLAVLIKKQTMFSFILVLIIWTGMNITFMLLPNYQYAAFLTKLPTFIYGVVLSISLFVYLQYLKKLVRLKPEEGV